MSVITQTYFGVNRIITAEYDKFLKALVSKLVKMIAFSVDTLRQFECNYHLLLILSNLKQSKKPKQVTYFHNQPVLQATWIQDTMRQSRPSEPGRL